MKKEECEDGDKSDQDLVVDDANDTAGSKENGKENGNGNKEDGGSKKDPLSPSSQRSTPASGASGSKGGKDADGKSSVASPASAAKMSPPISKALAGLGKLRLFIFVIERM